MEEMEKFLRKKYCENNEKNLQALSKWCDIENMNLRNNCDGDKSYLVIGIHNEISVECSTDYIPYDYDEIYLWDDGLFRTTLPLPKREALIRFSNEYEIKYLWDDISIIKINNKEFIKPDDNLNIKIYDYLWDSGLTQYVIIGSITDENNNIIPMKWLYYDGKCLTDINEKEKYNLIRYEPKWYEDTRNFPMLIEYENEINDIYTAVAYECKTDDNDKLALFDVYGKYLCNLKDCSVLLYADDIRNLKIKEH